MTDNVTYLRNGADALMRQLLATFGIGGLFWIGGIFCSAYIGLYFIQKYSWEEYEIKSSYFVSMVFESIFWSYLLFSNIFLVIDPTVTVVATPLPEIIPIKNEDKTTEKPSEFL